MPAKHHRLAWLAAGFVVLLAGVRPLHALDAAPKETPLARDLPKPRPEHGRRDAYVKYRMAQMALRDGDEKLVEKFLHEALALNPDNGALRYEYALFLASQGKGREARRALVKFAGDADLTAKAAYLEEKLKVAERLNGEYAESQKKVLDPKGNAKQITPSGRMAIDLGRVTWRQKAAGREVTQVYTFPVHRLPSGRDRYQLKLTWQGIDADPRFYVSDRENVGLSAQKTKTGWLLKLKTSDATGASGVVTFKPAVQANTGTSRGP